MMTTSLYPHRWQEERRRHDERIGTHMEAVKDTLTSDALTITTMTTSCYTNVPHVDLAHFVAKLSRHQEWLKLRSDVHLSMDSKPAFGTGKQVQFAYKSNKKRRGIKVFYTGNMSITGITEADELVEVSQHFVKMLQWVRGGDDQVEILKMTIDNIMAVVHVTSGQSGPCINLHRLFKSLEGQPRSQVHDVHFSLQTKTRPSLKMTLPAVAVPSQSPLKKKAREETEPPRKKRRVRQKKGTSCNHPGVPHWEHLDHRVLHL